jgi:hypothetical protein
VTPTENEHLTPIARFVIVHISRAVHVSSSILTTMHMQIDGEIVVKVNGLIQHCRGLDHESARCSHLRRNNHRALLNECSYRQQHNGTGDPSQIWVQAQPHLSLLRDLHPANKTERTRLQQLLDRAVIQVTRRLSRNISLVRAFR